jgi:Kef-type K+ transport system membrane component KefB
MSCGILLVALVETGQQKSRLGQLLLLVGSIGEFLTLFGLAGFNLMHRFGAGWRLVLEVGRALVLFIVAYLLLSLLRLLVWWAPHHFERLVHADDPSEIGVRAGFVLMLSLSTLASLVGLESILGSFLAGALFAFVFRQRGALDAKLSAIGQGFFIPLFFISVGVTFDVHVLANPDQHHSDGGTAGRSIPAVQGNPTPADSTVWEFRCDKYLRVHSCCLLR